ncbi:protein kinase domain-containing protein [Lyngbya aestuarii]|uniref:protein kinase domain-containing protein n=1 Tax=Lyngbya aestuarii TaxID=118322 RepID=UPI00403D584F
MSILALSTKAEPTQLLNGRYQVVEVLSNLGWGQTCIAIDKHQQGDPQCIVKEIRPIIDEADCWQATRHLFQREAQILNILSHHSQIPRLLHCREVEQGFYIVQELITGKPLSAELFPHQPWTESQVVQLLLEVLEILEFVHNQQIIHGALGPDNLIRRQKDSKIVLTDFSAIRQIQEPLVAVQEQLGSTVALAPLGYMSMELVRGRPLPCSDIYALGMIGIQALTGLHPVELEEDPQTGEIIWQQQARVNADLAAILSQMVRFHFKERYQTATDVLKALQLLVKSQPSLKLAPSREKSLIYRIQTDRNSLTAIEVKASRAVQKKLTSASGVAQKRRKLIGMGAAGVATSLAVGAGGYFLTLPPSLFNPLDGGIVTLAQATQKYQTGDFSEALRLAQSINSDSAAYQKAQAAIAQWQQDWQKNKEQFKAVENAFAQGRWQDVLNLASKTPNISFWQQQMQPMVSQAQANLEQEAQQLLQQAYNQAYAGDFTEALITIEQIPQGTKVYTQVQGKITEYTQKRRLKAGYWLHQAYSRAMVQDFTGALVYLRKIPQDSPAYAQAQPKIVEYTELQHTKANYLLQRAYNRAIVRNFTGALEYLKQIPEATPAYPTAQQKIVEYTAKQRLKETAQQAVPSQRSLQRNLDPRKSLISDSLGDTELNSEISIEDPDFETISLPRKDLNPGNRLQEVAPQTAVIF